MTLLHWLFAAEIHFGSKAILWREVIGNVFGLTSAVLGMRRRVGTWPIGIIGNVLLFTVFLGAVFQTPQDKNLYGQAGRQVLFAALSIYGWYTWRRGRTETEQHRAVTPHWTTTKEKLQILPVTIIFFVLSYYLLKALGSWGPMADAWIFTGSALATYGMARGYVEFWLVWIAVDAVGVPLLVKAGYYPSATLYLIYGVFVIWGFFAWAKIHRLEHAATSLVAI
ncbi:nicotinamide riboside transporter PnuC [mine drainage metagenome]|uniref:Nicotinamide riboside transporter PnuC n=1 Tax=mine drainage metagenome TaxID=410659 RepID=A0A1J5QI92_9ZZZZ